MLLFSFTQDGGSLPGGMVIPAAQGYRCGHVHDYFGVNGNYAVLMEAIRRVDPGVVVLSGWAGISRSLWC